MSAMQRQSFKKTEERKSSASIAQPTPTEKESKNSSDDDSDSEEEVADLNNPKVKAILNNP